MDSFILFPNRVYKALPTFFNLQNVEKNLLQDKRSYIMMYS